MGTLVYPLCMISDMVEKSRTAELGSMKQSFRGVRMSSTVLLRSIPRLNSSFTNSLHGQDTAQMRQTALTCSTSAVCRSVFYLYGSLTLVRIISIVFSLIPQVLMSLLRARSRISPRGQDRGQVSTMHTWASQVTAGASWKP